MTMHLGSSAWQNNEGYCKAMTIILGSQFDNIIYFSMSSNNSISRHGKLFIVSRRNTTKYLNAVTVYAPAHSSPPQIDLLPVQ